MNNHFLNQPIAIEGGYLRSLIPNLLLDFQQKNFQTAEEIEADAIKSLEEQASSARASGLDSFPVVISLKTPIVKYSTWRFLGTQTICRILQRLEADDLVSGVVFDIDSGGGMVSGTAELVRTIKAFDKPTLAYTNGYMCSAAMWIASACDARMAHPDADVIGSIGTMMSYQDFSALFEKYGATIYEVYAPESTEKNKEIRDLMKGDKKAYEERLSEINAKFIASVKSSLGSKLKDDGKVFKGKTYSPEGALEVGLIDEIGTLSEVLSNF